MYNQPFRHQGGVRTYWLLAGLAFAGASSEMIVSIAVKILALRVDAIHAFGDALAIGLAIWFETYHGRRTVEANQRLQKKLRVIIGVLIIIAGGHSGLESIDRWYNHQTVMGLAMIGTAALCATINRAMLFVLGACPCHMDIHLRAHIRSDFWISVGVAASGLGVLITGYWWIEPLTSSFISIRILLLGAVVALGIHKE